MLRIKNEEIRFFIILRMKKITFIYYDKDKKYHLFIMLRIKNEKNTLIY